MQGIVEAKKLFPGADITVELSGEFMPLKITAYALGNRIVVNQALFGSLLSDVDERSARNALNGWSPKGTSTKTITSHEYGHLIEGHIGRQRYAGNEYKRVQAWNNGTIATEIVGEAVRQTKRTEYGRGKSQRQLIDSMSLYAGTRSTAGNRNSEALADAVADYVANGANANPLSVAIYNSVSKRL